MGSYCQWCKSSSATENHLVGDAKCMSWFSPCCVVQEDIIDLTVEAVVSTVVVVVDHRSHHQNRSLKAARHSISLEDSSVAEKTKKVRQDSCVQCICFCMQLSNFFFIMIQAKCWRYASLPRHTWVIKPICRSSLDFIPTSLIDSRWSLMSITYVFNFLLVVTFTHVIQPILSSLLIIWY